MEYKIENEELQNNSIIVSAGSERKLTLTLTSLNDIDSKYELYYLINGEKIENSDIEVGYVLETVDSVKGLIVGKGGTKNITISVINYGTESVNITFGCEGGLINNELILTKGITTDHEIVNGDIIISYNLDGPNALYPDNFPGKTDGYTVTGVTCNGADAVWNNENWNVSISNMTNQTIKCNVTLTHPGIWNFPFINNYKTFVTPGNGVYKIELWGASGGDISPYVGGNGGYTSGSIYLNKGTELHVYVGGTPTGYLGGYNGGGTITPAEFTREFGVAGGGATDIRLVDGTWSDFNSLKSRIMVAGAGGGADYRKEGYGEGNGGSGGGLLGQNGFYTNNENGYGHSIAHGGSQNSGGIFEWIAGICSYENGCINQTYSDSQKGFFGFGGSGHRISEEFLTQCGGGAGYYGGSTGNHSGAGGGSSFISGHNGCDAISENSTSDNIIHTGNSNHYSGYIFTDTVMIDGTGYNWTTEKGIYVGIPSYADGNIISGNDGNGYARITYVGE